MSFFSVFRVHAPNFRAVIPTSMPSFRRLKPQGLSYNSPEVVELRKQEDALKKRHPVDLRYSQKDDIVLDISPKAMSKKTMLQHKEAELRKERNQAALAEFNASLKNHIAIEKTRRQALSQSIKVLKKVPIQPEMKVSQTVSVHKPSSLRNFDGNITFDVAELKRLASPQPSHPEVVPTKTKVSKAAFKSPSLPELSALMPYSHMTGNNSMSNLEAAREKSKRYTFGLPGLVNSLRNFVSRSTQSLTDTASSRSSAIHTPSNASQVTFGEPMVMVPSYGNSTSSLISVDQHSPNSARYSRSSGILIANPPQSRPTSFQNSQKSGSNSPFIQEEDSSPGIAEAYQKLTAQQVVQRDASPTQNLSAPTRDSRNSDRLSFTSLLEKSLSRASYPVGFGLDPFLQDKDSLSGVDEAYNKLMSRQPLQDLSPTQNLSAPRDSQRLSFTNLLEKSLPRASYPVGLLRGLDPVLQPPRKK